MADELYLSLWYPNFQLEGLPAALVGVVRQLSSIGQSSRVRAAAAYPISWNESPSYQRIYDKDETEDAIPELAVSAALEQLHDDFAYEFELTWELWVAEVGPGLEPVWKQEPRVLRVVGFGPHFDEGAYEQNGHIRVDFGMDTPFLHEDVELDNQAADYVKRNVEMLVNFTNAVQLNCGIATRLLWSESGESLAQKLIARLQQVN